MAEIKDYPCTYKNSTEIIVMESYHQLPNCNTVEAEALGADIRLDDGNPRVRSYVYSRIEDMRQLPKIDFEKGRIAETLALCRKLRADGKNVLLNITGPLTLLSSLIDMKYLFKTMRKDPDLFLSLLNQVQEIQLEYIRHAMDCGVNMLSYADPVGAVSIVGPKTAEYMVENFIVSFLKKAEAITAGKAIIFLCPKTSFALYGTGYIQWEAVKVSEPLPYVEAVLSVKDKVSMAGQMCVKNREFVVQDAVQAVVWKNK